MNKRELFFKYMAQTSCSPLALEIERAEGVYLYTPEGRKIIDLISGISVNNVGHRNPAVLEAINRQLGKYMHLMVYGEVIQSPQVMLAEKLASLLPRHLNTTYLVNSGSEANEGALKLAKKYTGRSAIVSFSNAYHGSTHGCLSIIGNDYYKSGYGPMLPGITRLPFNDTSALDAITNDTAAVITEVIQGEGGIVAATPEFLSELRERCNKTGSILIFDEVQTGFGRTGRMFAFEHYGIVPDVITFAKGMGGGMPIGAFTAGDELMAAFMDNPVLGHITTFGGHPVSAAAALASINLIDNPGFADEVIQKGNRFVEGLQNHSAVVEIRQHGLMIAVQLKAELCIKGFVKKALDYGILTDWFLFCENAFRIAPPLTITNSETDEATGLLNSLLNNYL